jgi:uncharacterized surface protein with fasciclin (FAS1) repeats
MIMQPVRYRKILAGIVLGLLLTVGAKAAIAASAAAVLENDPQFSDFTAAIKATGLWPILRQETAVTIFAPTNAAFSRLDRNWRNFLIPPSGSAETNPGQQMYQRQMMVKSTGVGGIHPESEFRGKVTRVKSFGGYFFEVDGTKPGPLVINPKPSMEYSIGLPQQASQKQATAGTPIKADNGYIYPTDGFTVE